MTEWLERQLNYRLQAYRLKVFMTGIVKFAIHTLGTLFASPFIRWRRRSLLSRIGDPERILYISLAYRGDLVLNFPAIMALRRKYPRARITCWVREYSIPLARLCPAVDDVISYDSFETGGLKMVLGLLRMKRHSEFIDGLKSAGFQLGIDDSGLGPASLCCLLARIPLRIGRNGQGLGFLFHYEYPYGFNKGLLEKRKPLLKPLGIDASDVRGLFLTISIPPGLYSSAWGKCGLKSSRLSYFTVQPSGGWQAKNWDERKFAAVIKLFAESTGLEPVYIGGKSDAAMTSKIRQLSGTRGHDVAGKLEIDESAAIVSRAAIHIGVDSFGSHVARACGVKSLTIFGPTNPCLIADLGERNIAVLKRTSCSPRKDRIYCCPDAGRSCTSLSCLRQLEADDVARALFDVWNDRISGFVYEF